MDEEDDGKTSQMAVDKLLLVTLQKFLVQVSGKLAELNGLPSHDATQRNLLAERWNQIRNLVLEVMECLRR